MTEVLGMPLDRALALLRAANVEPKVQITASPRETQSGTLRVIRVREEGKELTVACFADQAAAREE